MASSAKLLIKNNLVVLADSSQILDFATALLAALLSLDFSSIFCYPLLMKESIIRTISIKLDVNGHEAILQATQARFNEAASWIASICWHEHITNTNTAHHRVYRETRSRFGLGSQLAICARAKAVEAVKATRKKEQERKPYQKPFTCPEFGPRGSVRYDERSFSLKSLDRVSLLTLDGRITCRMILGNSTGETFSGAHVHTVRMRYHKRRQELQRVGTHSAKRRLKKMSGREERFQKDVNHKISRTLVRKAVISRKALALEDLTGIQDRVTVRRENRYERHSWAFYQLRCFIAYKAAWASVPVRFVDPRNTSRTCSNCGHCDKANRQSQATFLCQQCGFCLNADVNAAINISRVPVKVPLATSVRG